MVNALLKIDHKIVQEWANAVLIPNHMVVLAPNHTFLQGCANVVCTYVPTHKTHNCDVDRITGATHGIMSCHP